MGTARLPNRWLRPAWLLLLCIPCVAFAWAAIRTYQLSHDPTTGFVASRTWMSLLAPDADSLEDAAIARLTAALTALNSGDLESGERLATYRRELEAARSLLQRSLRANPVQPAALARLAAVRWEIDPQDSDSGQNDILRMIATASSLAAHVPEVQADLGALLSRMGRIEDAIPYLSRAVTLDPRVAATAVGAMYDAGIEPERISAALPAVSGVLVALRQSYLASGRSAQYIALLERSLAASPESVIRTYVDVCIEVQQASRAFDFMQALDPAGDDELDAARLLHASRASRAAGHGDIAVSLAKRARDLTPENPIALQELGLAYLSAGDPPEAVRTLREAVGAAAAANAPGRFRAALYGDLGRAEERAGHPDRAYDEYGRALQLDPGAAYPRSRLEAMRQSAGTREP